MAELQAETAVDDSDNHQRPSIPLVEVAEDAATLVLEVLDVVDDSEDGLQADEADENDSQASVGFVEELIINEENSSAYVFEGGEGHGQIETHNATLSGNEDTDSEPSPHEQESNRLP